MSEQALRIGASIPSPRAISYGRLAVLASVALLILVLLMDIGYVLFGHALITAMYNSDSTLANLVMTGKAETALSRYFNSLDQQILRVSIVLATVALGLLLSRNLLGVALSGISLLASSLILFSILELFPPLVPALHFDLIPYFKYRFDHIPDTELGMREKPLKHFVAHGFRGSAYSPLYGINEPAHTVIVDTDVYGFRNEPGPSTADIVILGSSFPGHGNLLKDTYAKKLEARIGGFSVSNLGMGGYGPREFVKVLERFGLAKKPQIAIFMFHTGDVERFLGAQAGREEDSSVQNRRRAFGSFLVRWNLALEQAWTLSASAAWAATQTRFQQIVGTEVIHPDVAILELPGGRTERLVILNRHTGRTPEDLLGSETWQMFGQVLSDFKYLCETNSILPILAYIPWSTEVYAEYTAPESGDNWLAVRESQIASSTYDEETARRLAEYVGIELISFLPAFKEAASHGKLLYLRTDTHWNSEGSDIAAQVTAAALRRYLESNIQTAMK